MIEVTDIQKLGVGLGGFVVFFLFLGMLLLFDKGLLAIGNIFCIVGKRYEHTRFGEQYSVFTGLFLVIGVEKSFRFFIQAERLKGSLCFFGGVFILLLGWPILGMIIEVYGFVTVFGGFFPMAINFLRCVPIVSSILALPGISGVCDSIVDRDQSRTR